MKTFVSGITGMRIAGILGVIVVLTVVYSWLAYTQHTLDREYDTAWKFETPDETINYFYATLFARETKLSYEEPLNTRFAEPIVFPRWTRPVGDRMYPGTFLGLIILFGSIAKVFGIGIIPFLTPFAASLCVVFIFLIVERIANRPSAVWSAFFLAAFPPFVYYASRGLFHTVVFLCFVLAGIFFSIVQRDVRRVRGVWWCAVVWSAVLFGVALAIRTSEIWWVGFIIGLLIWTETSMSRAERMRVTAAYAAILAAILSPFLIINESVYGSFWYFGYTTPNSFSPTAIRSVTNVGTFVQNLIFPFGVHVPDAITTVRTFVFSSKQLVMWALGLIGVVTMVWESRPFRWSYLIRVLGALVCVGYIAVLYGSWEFTESLKVSVHMPISSSYHRYYLPIFGVFVLPFAGIGFHTLLQRMQWQRMRFVLGMVFCTAVLFHTYTFAYASGEGLFFVRDQVRRSRELTAVYRTIANSDDLLLVAWGKDKVVFPDFRHVVNRDFIGREKVFSLIAGYEGRVWEIDGDEIRRVDEENY